MGIEIEMDTNTGSRLGRFEFAGSKVVSETEISVDGPTQSDGRWPAGRKLKRVKRNRALEQNRVGFETNVSFEKSISGAHQPHAAPNRSERATFHRVRPERIRFNGRPKKK